MLFEKRNYCRGYIVIEERLNVLFYKFLNIKECVIYSFINWKKYFFFDIVGFGRLIKWYYR